MSRPVAAITGASSGIGEVFARRLAATHDLVLVARRRERLETLAAELSAARGITVEVLEADLTRREDVDRVAERLSSLPALALLVNNAGFGVKGNFWEAELEPQMQMHELHVLATVALTHAALRNMVARGAGAVINVCSVAAFIRRAGSIGYGATKSWMTVFSEGLYVELKAAQSPVVVQALCPGFTYSEFHEVMKSDRTKIIGKSMWLTAERVVDDSLAGLKSRKLFVIPDWRYRWIAIGLAMMPAWMRLWVETRSAKP